VTYQDFLRRAVTLMIIVVTTGFIVVAVWNLADILMLIFFCWVLSVGFDSIETTLKQFGLRQSYAMLVTLIGLGLVLFFIFAVIIPPFIQQTVTLIETLPANLEALVEEYEQFYAENETLHQFLPQFTVSDYQALLNIGEVDAEVAADVEETATAVDVEAILQQALLFVGGVGTFLADLLANVLIIVFITGYLIADPFTYYRPIIAIVPQNAEQRVINMINDIRRQNNIYLGSRVISISFMTVTIAFTLGVIMNIPNAFALGLLAGLGSLIPNVGYYLGFIPIALFTFVDDPYKVVPALVIYWLLNEIDGKFISPRIIKESLNLPAGIILPFQIVAASVFGFFGILLAVPLMIIITTVIRELYVYDTLGKRGEMPKLKEDARGKVVLEYPNGPPTPSVDDTSEVETTESK